MRSWSFSSIAFFLIILGLFICSPAQTAVTNSSSSRAKRDQKKPGVYVSFDRFGKRTPIRETEKSEGVWLRLHNNMRFAIRTCTFGVSAQGDPLLVSTGREIGLKHDVEVVNPYLFDPTKSKIPPGYSFGNSCVYTDIKPGGSLSFSVPLEHLVPGLAIRIPFAYEWENIGEGNTQHFVLFSYSSIPLSPNAAPK